MDWLLIFVALTVTEEDHPRAVVFGSEPRATEQECVDGIGSTMDRLRTEYGPSNFYAADCVNMREWVEHGYDGEF